ncbi:hypothetical protein GCM10010399_04200 [Dactylosporangium fulvum]|uniref:DUF4132 domain-containing protein n=1 Tax=Dactylosporangium fulvum TaxID=53359 RepID=A0ABY5VRP6_9ACTN|nr:DUF4132 domain-containing protein [Dactylosporangium fulvum]UWP79965.1 DUF4132 domain-containing protein [Dactylosporangium fulvum]
MAADKGRKPVVVEGLVCAEPTVMAWQDGERDVWWSRAAALDHGLEQPDWVKAATSADRLSDLTPAQVSWLFAKGPEASARALLAAPLLLRHRQRIDVGRVAVARFELDALALALSEAGESADHLGVLVLPFRGPEAAALVAGWLRHLGSARLWARLWLHRHAETAARALIPAAAGRPGKARQNAEDALRYLAAIGHGPIIVKTADEYGTAALAAIAALLEPAPGRELPSGVASRATSASEQAAPAAGPNWRPADDLLTPVPSVFPDAAQAARKEKAPGWTRPERLPEIRLAGGVTMPEDEVARLVGALTRSRLAEAPEPAPGDPAPHNSDVPLVVESSAAAQPLVSAADPESERLIAGCDRQSLAEFGRALLDEWLTDKMPASEAWVVLAQAHVGDDATMDKLAPLVRSWPAKSRYARAIDGLAVLATVGTDVALRHLLAIEEGMSGGPTNERAMVYLTLAAARRGLSVTQLADRLAITHGLDTGVTLDYGPRAFTVATDDHLTAYAVGADGRRLTRPPKPGVKDTNPEAYQQFLRLKKDLRATAAAQIARLEQDMLAHRLRPARDLSAVLLPHPILGPIARRLLWGEYNPGKVLVRALRIAEDGSFADIHDTTAIVDGNAPLGIVHPAQLGGDLAGWTQIFADYEILQPFPQVHRPVVALTEAERAATSLAGFGPVATDRVAGLLRGRWQGNGYHPSSRLHTQLAHELPGGLTLLVELDPGVSTYNTVDEQRITEIWADDVWSDHWQIARRTAMGVCDSAALSELLVELYALKS